MPVAILNPACKWNSTNGSKSICVDRSQHMFNQIGYELKAV